MLFAEEEAPALKKWIVRRLEDTSDADADVLADYVLALLRHDGDVQTVRRICEAEIPDFLNADASQFIQNLFDVIQRGTYRLESSLSSKSHSASQLNTFASSNAIIPDEPIHGSRKRRFDQAHTASFGSTRNGSARGHKPHKAARYVDANLPIDRGNGGHGRHEEHSFAHNGPSFDRSDGHSYPVYDLGTNQASGLYGTNDANMLFQPLRQLDSVMDPPSRARHPVRKPRCRDYDRRGFCARGNACSFDHGQDSIFVGSYSQQGPAYSAHIPRLYGSGFQGAAQEQVPNMSASSTDAANFTTSWKHGKAGQSLPDHRSTSRSMGDKTNTSIVVENIPQQHYIKQHIQHFFAQFGAIAEITLHPVQTMAIIKYSDREGAKAAHTSPKVIFDNRFVKVYWYTGRNSAALQAAAPRSSSGSTPVAPTQHKAGAASVETSSAARLSMLQKLRATETARSDIEAKIKLHEAEKQALVTQLAFKTRERGRRGSADAENTTSASARTSALRAQLATLEAEANALGIDTTAPSLPKQNGHGVGRWHASRGASSSIDGKGHHGSFTNQPRPRFHAGNSAYNLDNRTKQISVKGVDISVPTNEEALRQYLMGFGEYEGIDIGPLETVIVFKDRFTAESFYRSTVTGEIPNVGKATIAWVDQTKQRLLKTDNPTTAVGDLPRPHDSRDETGVGLHEAPSPTTAYSGLPEDVIDYDVADDDPS